MIWKGMLGSQIRSVEYMNQLLQSEIIHHSPCYFRIANRWTAFCHHANPLSFPLVFSMVSLRKEFKNSITHCLWIVVPKRQSWFALLGDVLIAPTVTPTLNVIMMTSHSSDDRLTAWNKRGDTPPRNCWVVLFSLYFLLQDSCKAPTHQSERFTVNEQEHKMIGRKQTASPFFWNARQPLRSLTEKFT